MSEPIKLHADDAANIIAAVTDAVRGGTPWMTSAEASSYIRAPLSRIRKLTMTGEIPHHRDGRRVLFHRDELDQFIRDGGAFTP